MKKLPKKYAGVLFSFYASAVMVLIVSAMLVALKPVSMRATRCAC